MTTIEQTFAGVDICEDFLDIFLSPQGIYKRFDNIKLLTGVMLLSYVSSHKRVHI